MAIIYDNRLTTIGDNYIVRAEITREGNYDITDYLEFTTGETAAKYFTKEVRISTDSGSTFTNWIPLIDPTSVAASFVVTLSSYVVYEFRYTRAGTDNTGFISFDRIQLLGTLEPTNPEKIILHSIKIKANLVP